MKERENYMLCCDCGFAVKKSTMFIKKYQNTGICLCEKCAMKLCTEIADYGIARGFEIIKRGDKQCPSTDVVEAKHGKWEVTEHNAHLNVVCSNCKEDFYVYKKGQYRIDRSNYCPKCGARMDGKESKVKAE